MFESASGFSCTGSTVMADFESPGRGLMMYRQLTQWYGGMGVVVLAVRRNSEFRSYLFVLGLCSLAIVALLWLQGGLSLGSSMRAGVFNAVSLGTSTGFGNATGAGSAGDYVAWVAGAQLVLLFLMVVGGCTGSTAGGIKVMRMQVLGVVMLRSVRYSQTPRAVIPVRLGRDVISEGVVSRVAGFFLLHVLLVIVGVLVVTALGGDLETSLGGVVSALGNMGPALNEAGPTASFSDAFSQPARLVLAVLMVVGRLEIFPILLAFVPYVDRTRGIVRAVRH